MPIATDIYIDYTLRIVRRANTPSEDTHTVNAFYSYLMDVFDELGQMDDAVPMSAQTPTSYTMINGWVIQEELTHYLYGGAIQTSGYTDEIRTLICGSSGWTDFVAGDRGNTLTGGTTGDTGTILDWDNAAYKIWVRMDDSGDTFDDASETYTQSGTGAGTSTAISTTGEHLFANPYTLGTLEGTPTLYIFQNGERIAPDWWSTGHFDVLIKVTESDVDIDSKKITVFNRTWTDTFDHFEIALTSAGQNAVPLGTADDLNNTSTEATVEDLTDGTVATIAFDFSFTTPFSYDIGDGSGAQDYEVQIDCDSRPLSDVYEVFKWWTRTGSTTALETISDGNTRDGEEYKSANEGTYAEVKASPLGTFAGGKMFGARSVYFINLHADDAQNFQLIDKAGTTRYPPNYQAFTVNGVVSGDRVAVFLDTGAGNGVVDKAQYTSHTTLNVTGSTTYTVQETIPTDTPDAGTIILVNTGTDVEEVMTYTSWSGSAFTLSSAHSGGYDGTDTAYVPYIYAEATGTTVTETSTIYTVNRNVLCRVRKKGILPFETTGSFTTTGYTATAQRTADSIVTT